MHWKHLSICSTWDGGPAERQQMLALLHKLVQLVVAEQVVRFRLWPLPTVGRTCSSHLTTNLRFLPPERPTVPWHGDQPALGRSVPSSDVRLPMLLSCVRSQGGPIRHNAEETRKLHRWQAETPPQTCVVPLCERMHQFWTEYSQEVIGATSCTMQQRSPRRLGVPQQRNSRQEHIMIRQRSVQMCFHKFLTAKRCPQHFDALLLSWQIRTSPHSGCGVCFLRQSFENVTTIWTSTRCVPNLGFLPINADSGMTVQLGVQDGMDPFHPVRVWRRHVDIIQESKQPLNTSQLGLHGDKTCMLPQREQERHHCVSLCPSLALVNVVEQPDERKGLLSSM